MDIRKTLLLVEDEAIIALAEKKALEEYGYKVSWVSTGEEAVKSAVQRDDIDLILMDINLGDGIDGTDAAKIILTTKDKPIVFLSSHIEKDIVEKTEEITSYGYVVKNSGITVLDASIKMAFRLHDANRKTKEQKIHLGTTLHSIGEAVIVTDTNGSITEMNPAAEELTGLHFLEVCGRHYSEAIDLVTAPQNEDSAGRIEFLPDKAILTAKDGRQYHISITASPVTDADECTTGFVLVLHDRTDEYLSQRFMEVRLSLIEYANNHTLSELLTRALDEIALLVDSPVGFYHFVDSDQKIISLQQWSSRTLKEFCNAPGHGRHYDISQAGVWADCIRTKKPVIHNDFDSLPNRRGQPEGHVEITRELVVPILREGKVKATVGVGNKTTDYTPHDVEIVSHLADVTYEIVRWKQSEDVLKKSEDKLRSIFRVAPAGIGVVKDRKIIEANPRLCEMVGYSKEEILERNSRFLYATEEEYERVGREKYRQITENGTGEVETRYRRKDGSIIDVLLASTPIDIDDYSKGITFTVLDITGRKHAENELRKSEENFRLFFNHIDEAIALKDSSGNVVNINPAYEKIFGQTEQEIKNDPASFLNMIHPEDRESLAEAYNEETSPVDMQKEFRTEYRIVKEDGSTCWVGSKRIPLTDDQAEIKRIAIVAHDITRRKQAEEKIRLLLAEKELLLKEVHHRVKNNMLAMKDLLSLQAADVADTDCNDILTAAGIRISSMMVLYDRLYRNESTTDISTADYISSLVDEIVRIYSSKVKVLEDIENITIPVKIALPLGMIVNELVSNALKHAFAEGRENILEVILTEKESTIVLAVIDNGIGGKGREMKAGFGLTLLSALTKQLRGSFTTEYHNGTICTLEIRKPDN